MIDSIIKIVRGIVRISGATDSTLIGNTVNGLNTFEIERKTFVWLALGVASAGNKSMLAIMNGGGSGVNVHIRQVKIINVRTAAGPGNNMDFRFRRITALVGGTAVTARSHDTTDTVNGSVSSATGGTPTDLAGPVDLQRYIWSDDDWGSGPTDVESNDHVAQSLHATYRPTKGEKPITILPGQGFDIRQITVATTGVFDLMIIGTHT